MTDSPNTGAADAYGDAWAAVYDDEHRFLVPGEDQLGVLEDLASGRPALELGIGTGRVALPLAARGVDLAGVDASPAMVERLRAKEGGTDIQVAIGDMAELPVEGHFGLVYVVFNTLFGLPSQAAQVAYFKRVAAVLEPGGFFCLECFVPDLCRFQDGQSLRTVRAGSDDVRIDASVCLRYAWPAELDLMAQLAGLRLHRRWSDWQRRPFVAESKSHITIYELPR